MPLTLNLTSEIEQYLSQKAREKGLSLAHIPHPKCHNVSKGEGA
ncbi:hypothetical protein RVR34_00275 [Microcystis aeruginosa FBCC-A68]